MRKPVELSCPIACLNLSEHAYRPLTRAYGASFEPPQTVQDVLTLANRRQLHEITGIGKGRIAEILTALRDAGFKIAHGHAHHHDHKP